jgi:hypothetical protein
MVKIGKEPQNPGLSSVAASFEKGKYLSFAAQTGNSRRKIKVDPTELQV